MKYLWIFIVLSASAFGQNSYGTDYLIFHCTAPDPSAPPNFGDFPKPGLVPTSAATGNAILYCDAISSGLKISVSGSAYSSFGGGLPAGLTFSAPTLTVSTSGSGNGALALSGNTSGTATFTAPATAGTSTNPVTMTNILVGPAGAAATATFGDSATGGQNGMFFGNVGGGGGSPTLAASSNVQFGVANVGVGVFTNSTNCYGITSGAISAAADTAFCRQAAGVAEIGTAAGNSNGRLKAAGYMSVGTTFTSNAGCGDTTLTGGATAGKYTSVTAGTCTTIITMGNAATAPNGWSCTATDLTTAADAGNIHQTATTTTTASLNEGTIAASDVIQFSCIGY